MYFCAIQNVAFSLLFTVVVVQRVLFHKHIVMASLKFTLDWHCCHGNKNQTVKLLYDLWLKVLTDTVSDRT